MAGWRGQCCTDPIEPSSKLSSSRMAAISLRTCLKSTEVSDANAVTDPKPKPRAVAAATPPAANLKPAVQGRMAHVTSGCDPAHVLPRRRRAERSRTLQQKSSAGCMPLVCARISAAAVLAVAAESAAAVEFCCLPGSCWPGFYQQDAHSPQRHGRQWRMHGEQQRLDTRWLSGCRFPGAQKTCSPWHCVLRLLARVTRAGGGYDVKVRRELSRDNIHAGSRVATAHAPLGRRATERRKERANVIVVAFEKSSRPSSQLIMMGAPDNKTCVSRPSRTFDGGRN